MNRPNPSMPGYLTGPFLLVCPRCHVDEVIGMRYGKPAGMKGFTNMGRGLSKEIDSFAMPMKCKSCGHRFDAKKGCIGELRVNQDIKKLTATHYNIPGIATGN